VNNLASTDNPLTPERIEGFISDVTNGGSNLVKILSDRINDVSIRRSMQIGYMLACQDHGLAPPEFSDPAETLIKALSLD
jgi:hypothetical protein